MVSHKVTLIPGDGVGPEVTKAARKVIDATSVKISWEICEAGALVFKKGLKTGVPQDTIDSINRTRVVLKGPLETPVGYGEKSANVTLRKLFETYGNIRPIREMPGVKTPFSGRNIDLVIVRENVEDLYAGIEYMQTPTVAHALKLTSWKGCEKICRLAFEIARSGNYKKVHCATKANILKLTEGMLKHVFEEVAKEYSDIASHHIIVDNCAHQLVKKPEQFEVIVMTNMNGDILSDLTSGLIGGLGFAPSANIGNNISIFEAVHGSAPKYAGKNVINPTAAILAGAMMLRYLHEFNAAAKIEKALFYTMAYDKILTRDVIEDSKSVSTSSFTDAVIRNLAVDFPMWKSRIYEPLFVPTETPLLKTVSSDQKFIGVDISLRTQEKISDIGQKITQLLSNEKVPFTLKLITCRGVQVYPNLDTSLDVIDQICCRFMHKNEGEAVNEKDILLLLSLLEKEYLWVQTEKLSLFPSGLGYTKAQGEE